MRDSPFRLWQSRFTCTGFQRFRNAGSRAGDAIRRVALVESALCAASSPSMYRPPAKPIRIAMNRTAEGDAG